MLVDICNALDITIDYLLEKEYHHPASVVEKVLVNVTYKKSPGIASGAFFLA